VFKSKTKLKTQARLINQRKR